MTKRRLDLYVDEAGDPRAGGESLLARFLESDIQGSTETVHEILDTLDRVEAGEEDEWETTGNAFTLLVSPEGAAIEPAYLEEETKLERVSLKELRSALESWLELIEG